MDCVMTLTICHDQVICNFVLRDLKFLLRFYSFDPMSGGQMEHLFRKVHEVIIVSIKDLGCP